MKLKPCPFCGSAVSMIQIRKPLPGFEDVDKGDYEVFCARCNSATVFFKATQNVDELWNRRADNIPAADVRPVVRCKDCKHYDDGWCHRVHNPAQYSKIPDDWFCADGARMEGDGE